MKCFVGTDIIKIERIKKAILSTPNFREKIFTSSEISYAESKNDITKYECYAGRFAAKEAVYKSISAIYPHISLNEIEISNDKSLLNRPYVKIHNDTFNHLSNANEITIDISISHEKEYAIAFASTLIK